MKNIKKIVMFGETFLVNPNDKTLFLVSKNGAFLCGETTLKDAAKSYRGCNVVHKPFYVLIAQQFILKNSTHGLKVTEEITPAQYSEHIAAYQYQTCP